MTADNANTATREDYTKRLSDLRSAMANAKVDAFLVPVTDEFQSEYPPEASRRVTWLTGFTGSAGMAVVAKDNAALFADGRYTVQAKQQVDNAAYEQKNIPRDKITGWLTENLAEGSVVGYDPMLLTSNQVESISNELRKHNIEFKRVEKNLVDEVWADQPPAPCTPVKLHDIEYAGESSVSKRNKLAENLKDDGFDRAMITDPASIAWLLNVRGNDVTHTPLPLSYAMLHNDGGVDWFIDEGKITDEVRNAMDNKVRIIPMKEMKAELLKHGHDLPRTLLDAAGAPSWFKDVLQHSSGDLVEDQPDPCLMAAACKNDVEVEGMRQAHIRDGVALTKFLAWLDEEANKRDVTELEVEEKLLSFRKQQDKFQEPSFDTIAGSGEHGAIVHYRATKESNKVLSKDSIFLLDSGGQYLDGTTDVTRTTLVGEPTDEQKKRFTQVLMGHIDLGAAKFPAGTTGAHLDTLARRALWADGEDYAHGTGHGVGAYLGVHDGPQSISPRGTEVPIQEGMVISNEPGYYKEGEFGIRIESLVAVRKSAESETGRQFYEFETLTMAPIDRRLIDPSMLSKDQVQWLDEYHQQVFDTLSPHLDTKEKAWLQEMTRPLAREHAETLCVVEDLHVGGAVDAERAQERSSSRG